MKNQVAVNCNGVRVDAGKPGQKGGGEGNDCVHVVNVKELTGFELRDWLGGEASKTFTLLPDTDVLVKDEHDNVCQYTGDEWLRFVARIVRGELEHIGMV